MRSNIGKIDKTLRIIAGLAVFGAGYYLGSWWGLVGLLPLLSAFTGWCPAYSIFGISTSSVKEKTPTN